MGVRISDLPTANTMTDADYLEAEVSGESRKVVPSTVLEGSGHFSTTTGHDHDGVDSKKIDKEDIIGLTSSDSPTFSTVKLTDLSDGYIPYHSSDSVGLVDGVLKTDVDDAVSKKHTRSHSISSTSDHTSTISSGYILKSDTNGLPSKGTNTDTEVNNAVTKTHDRQHSITSILDHTSTATPGKILKADANGLPIDATNVTDDAQLKRAGGDINSFTLKTTPSVNDIVLIEDSADSYNKKKVKVVSLIGSFYTVSLGGQDGVTITHNLNTSSYITKVAPRDLTPFGMVGDISMVRALNTVTIYNSGIAGINAEVEITVHS